MTLLGQEDTKGFFGGSPQGREGLHQTQVLLSPSARSRLQPPRAPTLLALRPSWETVTCPGERQRYGTASLSLIPKGDCLSPDALKVSRVLFDSESRHLRVNTGLRRG